MHEYKVYIIETVTRPIWVAADSPAEAERVAEENYEGADVSEVVFEADPASRRNIDMRRHLSHERL